MRKQFPGFRGCRQTPIKEHSRWFRRVCRNPAAIIQSGHLDRMREASIGSDVRVKMLTEPNAIMAQRARWQALCADLSVDSMFMSWEWLETLLEQGSHPLNVLEFQSEDGLTVALVPVFEMGGNGLLGGSGLSFGAGHFGWPNQLDFACSAGWAPAVAKGLARWLADRRWGRATFRRFRTGSPVLKALIADREGRFQVCRQSPSDSPSFNLPDSLDGFYAGLTKSFRKKLRYKVRRLSREFSVSFDFAEPGEEVTKSFDRLLELHRARLREQGAESHFADRPESVAFHRSFCGKAAARGDLRLGRLRLNGTTVAVSYDVRAGNTVFMYNTGFDPAFQNYSPGNVLTVMAIDRYIQEGVVECNMMVGAEPYKFAWAHQVCRDDNVVLFPGGPIGQVRRRIFGARMRRSERRRAEIRRQKRESVSNLGSFLRVETPPVVCRHDAVGVEPAATSP